MGLTVSRHVGQGIWVNDTRVEVIEILGSQKFKVRYTGKVGEHIETVTALSTTELPYGTKVSAGDKDQPGRVKLHLEAPKHVKLKRDEIYEGYVDGPN